MDVEVTESLLHPFFGNLVDGAYPLPSWNVWRQVAKGLEN